MARPLGLVFPGAVYHITSRGNDRKEIFGADLDRKAFLEILYRVCVRYHWLCRTYCLTAGQRSAPPCLTVDWILGQLASERKIAEGIYRQFVRAGIRAESIWKDLKGQNILGEDAFVKGMKDHITGKEHIPEISKRQRFISRPILENIFTPKLLQSKEARDERIIEAVERYGYSQKQIADHLGLHFSSTSRIMRMKKIMSKK
ncbi:MAG: hypothetical protein V2B13_11525 [Pseudomonadota bacterium]